MKPARIKRIVQKHKGKQGELMLILEGIQSVYRYLPEDALREVARLTGRSLVDIYSVATFYRSFSLTPRGRHLVSVCLGTACHVRGAPRVAKEFERQLGIKGGETTSDQEFTLETVNCLGACALGPVVVIDGRYFPKVTKRKVKEILDKTREGLEKVEIKTDKRIFRVRVRCPRCNHSLIDPDYLLDGYPAVRVTASFRRKHGWLVLSSLFGSYTLESQHKIPMDAIVNVFCPYCSAQLMGASNCAECGAPMIPFVVEGGGMVQVCSRRGCKEHMLDLSEEAKWNA